MLQAIAEILFVSGAMKKMEVEKMKFCFSGGLKILVGILYLLEV